MIENTDKRHHREGNIRFGSSNWGSLRVFEKAPFKLWAYNIINSDFYQSNFLYSPRCFILQKNSRNCMTVQTLSNQLYHLLIENDSSENIVWLSSQVQASLWWPGRFFSSTTKWFMLELIFHVMDRTKLRGIHSKHYQLSFTISSFSSLSSHDYLSGYSHAPQNDLCSNYFFHAMDRTKHHLQILVFFVNLPLTVCVKLLPLLPRFPFVTFTFLNVMEKEDTK